MRMPPREWKSIAVPNERREAFFFVADESRDPMVKAEAESLANFELGNVVYGMTFCLLLIL
jgi:hypothetical protein